MKYKVTVLAAMTVMTVGVIGCSGAGPVGKHVAARPLAAPGPTRAARANCRAGQLGGALEGSSQPGTGGTALAIVYIWDKSATACTLVGSITVSGLDRDGRQVTTVVRFVTAPGSGKLSPDVIGPDRDGRFLAKEVTASMLLIAAGSSVPCSGQRVDPVALRIVLPSGGSFIMPNASPVTGPELTRDGGLATCRGSLYGQSPILITHN